MCQFDNCKNPEVHVTVIYHGERSAFCCVDHAALWLLRQRYPRVHRVTVHENETELM